jgi:hypothetical protein
MVALACGCSADHRTTDEVTQQVAQAVTGSPFFYLRCNLTDWNVDEGSRLKATADPSLFTTTIQVPAGAQPDPCSVTEAIASGPDQWGNGQVFFSTPSNAPLFVPGTTSALVANTSNQPIFYVHYPAAGQYVATFNVTAGTLAIAPAATVSGRVTQAPGSGLSGTVVSLTGPSGSTMATAITDANGSYKFSNVAPAAYSLGFAVSPGSTGGPAYSPASPAVSVLGGAVLQNATCTPTATSGCTVGPAVTDPFHQLFIVDPAVTDPTRNPAASNAADGHLSFRYVMEQLAGTCPGLSQAVCVSNFVLSWFAALGTDVVNGFSGAARNSNLLNHWPTLADGVTLDMSKAPLQLLAVVNRTDLHRSGNGEARLIYGIKVPGLQIDGNLMTVIFEFALPSTPTSPNRLGWVNQFFSLPNNGSKSCQLSCASAADPVGCAFACNVQLVTDQFIHPAQLIDLRTNEIFLSPGEGTWAWRQFVLSQASGVNIVATSVNAESADFSLNNKDPLGSFLKANEADFETGFISLPIAIGSSPVLGGISTDTIFNWSFSSFGVDEPARHAFSGRACNGCHNLEEASAGAAGIPTLNIDGFFHVTPLRVADATGQNLVSPFVTQIELPRRASFMSNQLACGSANNCAAGVDVNLMQP